MELLHSQTYDYVETRRNNTICGISSAVSCTRLSFSCRMGGIQCNTHDCIRLHSRRLLQRGQSSKCKFTNLLTAFVQNIDFYFGIH